MEREGERGRERERVRGRERESEVERGRGGEVGEVRDEGSVDTNTNSHPRHLTPTPTTHLQQHFANPWFDGQLGQVHAQGCELLALYLRGKGTDVTEQAQSVADCSCVGRVDGLE